MVNDDRSTLELVLNSLLDSMKFEDAVKETNDRLGHLMESAPEILECISREREDRITKFTKLTEVGTSRQRDLRAIGWYAGIPTEDGVWGQLKKRMRDSGLEKAVRSVDNSSSEIVASLAEPLVDGDKRLGLVIGNVQSGKTANYSAVIAKALDCRYRMVIVLAGVHNNLRKQTQQRLDRDLGVLEKSSEWYPLTGDEADFGTAFIKIASAIGRSGEKVLAVVKKNSNRLRNLLEFIRSMDEETKRRLPILIVDDESDQATPDSSPNKEDEPTAINTLMREVWAEVRNGTYVGYTATPFANIFMDPNSHLRTDLQELYPKDFIHVMPTQSEYFGAEKIFGLNEAADERNNNPDVVREIPQAEVKQLVPKGKGADLSSVVLTKTLSDAVKWFVVATAVRRIRGQAGKHSTMLIHTTHRTEPHFAMRDAVEEFLAPLRQDALVDKVSVFLDVFKNEMNRAGHLYRGDGPPATWKNVSREIPGVLHSLRVAVDNGRADDFERLAYSDEQPQTVIVIGGGTLSRGLTLEGLFVSFFCRTSNTYDTLLQMGRWFGYRNGYEDLQRIWLSPGLDLDYRFLATVEADLRSEIELMTRLGQKPAEIGVRVRQHPGRLQITNPAKMKHTDKVAVDFEGARMQTTLLDVSETVIGSNARSVERLLLKIKRRQFNQEKQLYKDVPIEDLQDFIDEFTTHERYREPFEDAFGWAERKLPAKLWNVVVPTGSGRDALVVGETKLQSIQRAPIQVTEEGVEAKQIDIRALMSGEDIVADVRAEGRLQSIRKALGKDDNARLSNKEQFSVRKSKEGADGRGLLILYPVSRYSRPVSTSNDERIPMEDALNKIDPALVREGLPPLIGVAVIAPYDTENDLDPKDKGTLVAVQPIFNDIEIFDGDVVEDNERDFDGGVR